MSGKVEGEPPRKKRRSKWDIHPEDLPTPPVTAGNHETTPPQPPTSAAAAVAAKLNAKLASEGKLKPASAVYMPASSSVSFSPSPLASSSLVPPPSGHTPSATPIIGTPTGPTSSTIEINDLDVREQLTKPATLTDINKTTGVMVTVRGKQLNPDEKIQENTEAPLHLHIQGPNKDKVDAAVIYINSLIRSLQQARGKGGVALLSTPPIPPLPPPQHSSGPHYIQDKVFVGLEKAPEEFKAKSRVEGIGGSFLGHIASQTGAKVYLRGRGSGFLEPTSGRESFEAMYLYISHSNQEGLTAARKLCESLIQTVQKDFEMWKRSQQPLGFGGQAPSYHRPQYTNPYQHGAYPQPPFGPMPPSGGGPNFGPPPPGAYPPPPPGYGFYPGPPMPPPAGPYGPPHPGGFGPPPPADFQPPGPPRPPYHQPPQPAPQQIPLPPEGPSPEHNSSHFMANKGEESVSGGPVVQPNPPAKRRFTETARNTNGLSTAENVPYWAKLQEPPQLRRFTEGPPPNQQTATNDEKEPLPTTPQDQTGSTVVDQETSQRQAEPDKQTEEAAPDKDQDHHSEEVSRLMPPPPAPLEKRAVSPAASSSMPPPSFLPPRVASTADPTSSEPAELPEAPPPPSNDCPPPTPPPPSSTSPAPPPPKPTPSGPLVSYGEDSDSDIDS